MTKYEEHAKQTVKVRRFLRATIRSDVIPKRFCSTITSGREPEVVCQENTDSFCRPKPEVTCYDSNAAFLASYLNDKNEPSVCSDMTYGVFLGTLPQQDKDTQYEFFKFRQLKRSDILEQYTNFTFRQSQVFSD